MNRGLLNLQVEVEPKTTVVNLINTVHNGVNTKQLIDVRHQFDRVEFWLVSGDWLPGTVHQNLLKVPPDVVVVDGVVPQVMLRPKLPGDRRAAAR